MVILAAIIRDLDHETARTETGGCLRVAVCLTIVQDLRTRETSIAAKCEFRFRYYIGVLRRHTGHHVFRIFSSFESLHAQSTCSKHVERKFAKHPSSAFRCESVVWNRKYNSVYLASSSISTNVECVGTGVPLFYLKYVYFREIFYDRFFNLVSSHFQFTNDRSSC